MPNEVLLLLVVCVPLLGSFVLPLISPVSEKLRNYAALALLLITLACAVSLMPAAMAGQVVIVQFGGVEVFQLDRLAVFMAFVSSMVGSIIVFYSFGYISEYDHRSEYYFMVVLFLGSMMGLIFSKNLLGLYVFWEITAIACWRLIGFFRSPDCVRKADKAFLVTVFGAVCMLFGFIMIYAQAGSFDLGAIQQNLHGLPVSNLAVALILLGILSKSATVPLHTWLPDAGVAPSPVTALLHAAVLVKIGVYVYARLFLATFAVDPIWNVVVPTLAAVSALVSAGAALIETDLKRIIAYSTISQIAFIFLGLSIGNSVGVAGGMLYILMHGIAKGGLFLCAGIVLHGTHERDITKMGGLIHVMPLTAVSFLLCAASVMGIPPMGGFFSKYMVVTGAFNAGHTALALTFLAGAVLTLLYLFRVFNLVFLGDSKGPWEARGVHEHSAGMVGSVCALAILSVLAGVFIQFPFDFVQSAVQQMGVLP